ncbi:cytochrome P450 [Butyriboletus roseoflavus]|nr:cytochrome P450 [Butyriboletus roseoflavus]
MTGSGSVYTVGFVLCAAFVLNAWRQHRLRDGLPLPPGPIGLPLIGSIFDVNPVHPWLSYEQWGKRYGHLQAISSRRHIYANLLGKDFIIINNAKVAHDLLDRRSTIYSGRPYTPATEIIGMGFNSGLLSYSDKWRLHRKMYNTAFNKQKAIQYQQLAIRKARQLVGDLLDAPKDYTIHCRTFAGATIMAATYGHEVASRNDPFVTKIEHYLGLVVTALTPERAAVLLAFPFLANIPSWFPGGEYKQRAAEGRVLAEEVLNKPFQYVVENMGFNIISLEFGLLQRSLY